MTRYGSNLNAPSMLKKRLILAAKIAIVLAVVGWVAWELQKSWHIIGEMDKLEQGNFKLKADYGFLALSGILYVVAYVPAAFFWRYSMQSLGQSPRLYESFRAYYIGHLGKYVPGKGMVVILRSGLLNHDRTRPSIAAAAVFLETLTMMAVGAFLSAVIIIVWFRNTPNGGLLSIVSLGMMLVAGLPIFPPVFRVLAKKLGVGRKDPLIDEKLAGLTMQTLGVGWLLMTVAWVLLGLSLWASIRGVGFDTGPLLDHLPRFTLAAALPVVLGFVAMIPGGMGVREFAMAQVLTAYFAAMLAQNTLAQNNPALNAETIQALAVTIGIIVAGVQRLVSIVAELLISAALIRDPSRPARMRPV